jgi:hypothetical protein
MTTTDSSSDDRERLYEEAREKVFAEIQERARLYSESRVYRLNNQYLSERQRVDVEMWFTAPIELFYAGIGTLLILKQSILSAILFSSVFSVAFMEYFFWNAKSNLFYLCHRAVLGSAKGHILTIALFVGSVFISGTPWGVAILLVSIYLLTAVSPSIITSVIFHGRRMHPKFAFAKRRFNLQYPWDLIGV